MDYQHHIHQLQQHEQEQQVDLEVVGRHALLFDDDTTLAFINSSDALVPWSGGDPSLLIDRYDVRHLLHRLPPPRASRKLQQQDDDVLEPDGISRAELDLERYRDLESGSGEEDEERKENTEVAKSGSYRTVPFSYGASGELKGDDTELKCCGFQPPFPVPDHLHDNLPPTEKVHQIISRTAKFVSEHGGQSEIILRVKQGGNPTFGFLMPDHKLHAYFRFLVDNPEFSKGVTDSADREEGKKTSASMGNELPVTGGALSLLGSIYGYGEDDGGAPDNLEVKEPWGKNADNVTCTMLPCKSEVPSSSLSEKAKIAVKLSTTAVEKPLQAKKSRSITVTAGAAKSKAKEASAGSVNLCISRPETNTSDPNTPIVEPPSSLKRMVDKTVEFIRKNGREFEASLIQQDKTNEKFPFLRPSSQYHSYYLKVLQDTHESKLPRKHLSDHRNLSVQHVRSTTEGRRTASDGSLSDARDMMNQFEGSYQLDRKEKFRMVIGGAKKDTSNSSSKPSKPAGLSAEEAAAVVMAATRGINSKTISDTAPKTSAYDPVTVSDIIDGRRSSSLGSSPSFPDYNPPSKTVSDGKAGGPLPGCLSHDTGRPDGGSCSTASGVLVANVIAETVASEADSSDACLTKEQKLKSERLKRAKVFAAMIKSKHITSEVLPAIVTHGESEKATASSILSGRESDLAGREREDSSLPVDAEIFDSRVKSHEKTSIHDSRKEYSLEKDESGLRLNVEDSNGEHKHSRKRHHTRHSSHSSRHNHKQKHHSSHRRKHHDSEDEELHTSKDKQKRKHHSSSKHKHQDSDIDEIPDGKKSESRHRHEHHRSSDNESPKRKASRRHRKRSRMEENQKLENQEDLSMTNLSKQVSLNSSNGIQEVARPLVSEDPSSVATVVPDDLRAKIRAMLLETM
ncbi:hypothetical protein Taro_004418 [Colocasia esculenta]|uniref:SURP motif domain-containing protein n=1 Tax=Colocasia esculenta TaxID=4460 RepID=A0A843TUW0_COLES|nr:hypothetical protein [Colocasia esculenta]